MWVDNVHLVYNYTNPNRLNWNIFDKLYKTMIMLIVIIPYFLQSPVFYNHFEELQTMLFEVELIINNAPLIYVYPNTIETCSTPTICYLADG